MTKTNWRKMYNPDLLGAYSLDDGNGGYKDVIYTIKNFDKREVVSDGGRKEIKTVAFFKEQPKPMVVNATNFKTMQEIFKSKYIEDYVGRKIQIGVEEVKVKGDLTDALRIRKFLPSEQTDTPICVDCGEIIKATERMTAKEVVAFSRKRYGANVCADCVIKRTEAAKAAKAAAEENVDPANGAGGIENDLADSDDVSADSTNDTADLENGQADTTEPETEETNE